MPMMGSTRDGMRERHAIVLGGSIGGCLAAEVLSSVFDRVTLIEKGDFDDNLNERRGVPQEKHVHLLLLRGKQVMEEIFPGLLSEMERAGAEIADQGYDVKCFHYGQWKNRFYTGVSAHYCSRSLLDNLVRRRIQANPRITVLSKTRVLGLKFHREGAPCIQGVLLDESAPVRELAADLVVDVSGRG